MSALPSAVTFNSDTRKHVDEHWFRMLKMSLTKPKKTGKHKGECCVYYLLWPGPRFSSRGVGGQPRSGTHSASPPRACTRCKLERSVAPERSCRTEARRRIFLSEGLVELRCPRLA